MTTKKGYDPFLLTATIKKGPYPFFGSYLKLCSSADGP
jgi:hypothetical protein